MPLMLKLNAFRKRTATTITEGAKPQYRQFHLLLLLLQVMFRGGPSHRRPQACPDSDDTALSLKWTCVKGGGMFVFWFAAAFSSLDSLCICIKAEHTHSGWPGERVVKDERVFPGLPDFKLPLDCLFVRVTASQWDQDLQGVKHRHPVWHLELHRGNSLHTVYQVQV